MTNRRDSDMTGEDFERAADEAYDHRDELDDLEVVEFVAEPDVRSVVSVRFNRGELKRIEQAAQKAGMPVSTYIRNAALATSETVDLDVAREALQAIRRKLNEATAALSGRATAA
jgi:predicted DNA binding CopG/RHH family protein